MVINQFPRPGKGQKEVQPIIILESTERMGWYKVKFDLNRDFPGVKTFDNEESANYFFKRLVEKEKEIIIMAKENEKETTVAQEIAESKEVNPLTKNAGANYKIETSDIYVKSGDKPYIAQAAWRFVYKDDKALTEKDLKTRPTEKQMKLAKSYGLVYNPNKVCAKQMGYALWKRSREPMTEKLSQALDKAGLEYTKETTLVQGYAALVKYRHEKANDTLRNKPATEKQKEFAETLGIEYSEDINALDMFKKIHETRKQKVNKETMEAAQKEGMEVTPDSNQNTVELALAKAENDKIVAKDPVVKEKEKAKTKSPKARSAKQMPAKEKDKDKQKTRSARQ